jgi:tRNA(fMet)-specific endonuclease VapC
MKYVIDTDILIYFLNKHSAIVSKFQSTDFDDITTTIINYSELLFGAYNSLRVNQNLTRIKDFLNTIKIVDFDKSAGEIFAQLKSTLRKEGKILADIDLMIAATCLTNDLISVTNNTKHFSRISKLKIENWYS